MDETLREKADGGETPYGRTDREQDTSGDGGGPPLLTIGILFKDEIRCIQRCLDSLTPLRQAVPCELLIADTGSSDGSRAIAARYADLLFDFPWRDDFAAARNALLDRASGQWYLTIDCDEWLDPAAPAILADLTGRPTGPCLCLITQRNYENPEPDQAFTDVLVGRLFTRTPEGGYKGAVHEQYLTRAPDVVERRLPAVILHHDGYVDSLSPARGQAKRRYYQRLLRGELDRDPDNLFRMGELLDCGEHQDPAWREDLRRAMDQVERLRTREAAGETLARKNDWRRFGPPVFRYAVQFACEENLPDLPVWAGRAEELFPASFFIRLDVNAFLSAYAWLEGDWQEAAARGEAYLAAWDEYQKGGGRTEQADGAFLRGTPHWHRHMKLLLAASCAAAGQTERAKNLLASVPYTAMDGTMVRFALEAAAALFLRGIPDSESLAVRLWDGIQAPSPTAQAAEERQAAFLAAGGDLLDREGRVLCPLFLPLGNRCPLGGAAARLDEAVRRAEAAEQAAVRSSAPPELLALAEQVRTILAAYPPDDPAVQALKDSPVYRRVAYLLEDDP